MLVKINAINLFSPKIGFPFLYILINMLGFYKFSFRLFLCLVIFYLTYYLGIIVCQFQYRDYGINRLNFQNCFRAGNVIQSKALYFLSKCMTVIYLFLIVFQYLRIGINNADTFRLNWLHGIPMGTFWSLLLSLGLIYFVYVLTKKYIIKQVSCISYIFWSICIIGIVSLLGSRSVLSIVFFSSFFVFYCSEKVSSKKTLYITFIVLVLFILLRIVSILYGSDERLIYYLESGKIDYSNPITTLWNFIVLTVEDIGYRTQKIIDSVPEIIGYTKGESLFFSFYSMLPGEQINPAIKLNHELFFGSSEDGGYPPTIVAQIYLDFGYIGLFIVPLIIGYWYEYFYMKARKYCSQNGFLFYMIFTYCLLLSCYGEFLIFNLLRFIVFIAFWNLLKQICLSGFRTY